MELEENNLLPLLDVLIERKTSRFLTRVYLKPIFSGLYFTWDSFVPKARKINLINRFIHSALMLCSECRLMKQMFLMNGYPEFFKKVKVYGPTKRLVYVKMMWIGPVSQISVMCHT